MHVAHRLSDRFPDGRLFVDLHGHTVGRRPLSAGSALDQLLRAVGVPDELIPKDLDEKAGRWRAELADRRVLVVLDNAFDAAQVRPLLPGSPRCLVVVTSRRRLVGLHGADVLSLDVLPDADAVALFRQVAGPDRAGDGAEAVAGVVRLCGNLPLAIGIVAARIRNRPSWTVEYVAGRLLDEHGRLTLLAADDHGVAAAFSLSYQHLPPAPQRLFRLLGLHPGADIDGYAAAALADLPLADASRELDALCDAHLLTQYRPDGYRFHDLIRAQARASVEADEAEPARHRLLDYYLHVSEVAADLIATQRRRLGPAPEHPPAAAPALAQLSEARSWFQAEHGNLLAVVAMAAEHGPAGHGWQIPRNVATYLWRYGHFAMGAAVLRTALADCGPGTDPAARTVCLLNLAQMYQVLGEYGSAMDCLRQGVAAAHDSDDHLSAASALAQMADLSTKTGSFADAATFAARAVEIYRGRGERRREAEALVIVVDALTRLGRSRSAVDEVRRAAIPPAALQGDRVEGILLGVLGTARSCLDEHDIALGLLTRSVEIARQAQDRPSEAAGRCRLAQALRRSGRYDEALRCGREGLDILRDVPDPADLSDTHNALGATYHDLGAHHDALTHYRLALTTAAAVDYPNGRAHALDGIGQCLSALGDHDGARHHWQQAYDTFTELGTPEAGTVQARLRGP